MPASYSWSLSGSAGALWLAVNGIDLGAITLEPAGVSEDRREIGDTAAAFSGKLRKTRQTVKHDVTLETKPILASEALAWDGLLRGLGERWAFDTHLYGSKGLGPSSSASASIYTLDSKFGGGCLKLLSGAGSVVYPTAAGSNWTVAGWRKHGGGSWSHYILTSTGTKWVDGVPSGAAQPWFAMDGSGNLTLAETLGTGDDLIDDLVVVPYVIPSAWGPAWGTATGAFSALPQLSVAGTLINETSTRTMLGHATWKVAKVWISGSFQTDARKLSVTLQEV